MNLFLFYTIFSQKKGLFLTTPNEIFLRYPASRDVLFVFGAGASQPDGVPLQKEMLPMILDGRFPEIENSEIGKQVIKFIRENFIYKEKSHRYPELEAVFGFLDYFIQYSESINLEYHHSKIESLKEFLIHLLHYIVDYQTDKTSNVYTKFWDWIQKYNSNISIITLNYDTLIEQAFDKLFSTFGYIDYCMYLMNYKKCEKLEQYGFWINPREPVPVSNNFIPVPIKLLKVHGSLNWKYCNCCNQVLLTPWDRKIDLNKGTLLGYTYPEMEEYEYVCPLDGTNFQTLIVPPSYIKPLTHPIITNQLSEASREIRETKKIVFIGYSLSNADVHIKALFKKHLKETTDVIVVNNKISKNLKLRYQALNKNAKFIKSSFEELVENEDIMMSILT